LFATLGAVTFAIAISGWIRWFLSDDFNPPTPGGPDRYQHLTYLRCLEIGSALVAVYLAWHFVARPWIREHRLSFDGKLVLGMIAAYFWEPMVNFYNYTFAMNTHSINFGTWADFIPGFTYPNQRFFPDGTLYALPQYMYSGATLSLLGGWWMAYSARRLPRLSTISAWWILFVAMAVIWLPFEYFFFIRPQVWVYASTVPNLTLFDGTLHQLPLYEGFIMAGFGCGLTLLRITRDDRGHSFVEKGIDEVPMRWRNAVSTLAVAGAVCVWTGFSYYAPFTWLQVQANQGIEEHIPSYLRAGICGEGTDYACPDSRVPVPRRDTTLQIRPDDPRLMEQQR
jgi:hypothetical protein